jgi:hypothetical protein
MTHLTQQQLYDAMVALDGIPDDSGDVRAARGSGKTTTVTDLMTLEAYDDIPPSTNRRGRRTARRSKHRRRWLRERKEFLSLKPAEPGEWACHDQVMLVVSQHWVRMTKNYYNIEREL